MRFTINEFKNVVRTVVARLLNENSEHESIKPGDRFMLINGDFEKTVKILSKKYNVNPSAFKKSKDYSREVVYQPSVRKPRQKREIPGMKEGESVGDYVKGTVCTFNRQFNRQADTFDDASEHWRQVPEYANDNYLDGIIPVSDMLWASDKGRLILVDPNNPLKCKILGYDTHSARGIQAHIDYGDQHTTGSVAKLIASAWLNPNDERDFFKKYTVKFLNGDYTDLRVDNLEVVRRSRSNIDLNG